MNSLQSVVFKAGSFQNAYGCSINSNPVLASVVYEGNNFNGESSSRRLDDSVSGLTVVNCALVRELILPGTSFTRITVMTLVELPSLTNVVVSDSALPEVKMIQLVGVEKVERVVLGAGSLNGCEEVKMERVATTVVDITTVIEVRNGCLQSLQTIVVVHTVNERELAADLKEKLGRDDIEIVESGPTTMVPTVVPSTEAPTTEAPTEAPTTLPPTTIPPTTLPPTTIPPTTLHPTTIPPTPVPPTTLPPTTLPPTTIPPTTLPPITLPPTTQPPTTLPPTTLPPTTLPPTTLPPTTLPPTTLPPITLPPTTQPPTEPPTEPPTTPPPTLPPPTSYTECWSSSPVSSYITQLEIDEFKCNSANVTVLDLSKYPKLKSVMIGKDSFWYADKLRMVGMNALESVIIGENCFESASLEMKSTLIHVK